ncbi:leucine-rich repeat transmembrane neuronal protein 4 [Plakobranchus ocellatus]|uniref:Leucine-rich repeat transmembrane neuronal protein 4 n=1 Tax=Plakobranchus ocellatus TaxID=259542 RepID=A0AAV4BJY1_9GAST|nr:leucine-rich repeat transmembrane neuronal protein 4 [Plakobranchus ocellatus]
MEKRGLLTTAVLVLILLSQIEAARARRHNRASKKRSVPINKAIKPGSRIVCPESCRCGSNRYVRCRGSGLSEIPTRGSALENARTLSFAHYETPVLRSGSFSNANRLILLFLDHNGIRTIESGAFKGLTSLRFLLLGNNRIKQITKKTFNPGGNRITHIAKDAFKGLHFLSWLDLSNNLLTSAGLDIGNPWFKNMGYLNIGNNSMETVPKNMKDSLPRILWCITFAGEGFRNPLTLTLHPLPPLDPSLSQELKVPDRSHQHCCTQIPDEGLEHLIQSVKKSQ